MKRFSSIIDKTQLEKYFVNINPPKSPLTQSYNIDILDTFNMLIASDGFMLEAQWGANPMSEALTMPFIDFKQVHVKPSFRMSFRTQRSIIVADSFYTWKNSERKPIRVQMEDGLMFIPAIYFKTTNDNFGFTIITRSARKSLRAYSEIEPVIFGAQSVAEWLDFLPVAQVIKVLQTTLPVPLRNHIVSQKILVKGFNGKVLHETKQEQPLLFN